MSTVALGIMPPTTTRPRSIAGSPVLLRPLQRALIAVFCNFPVGYGERRRGAPLVFVLPVTQNLISVSQSMKAQS
jgi:hypothetical protein